MKKNPVSDCWYADPESRVYGGRVYFYVTNSLPFEQQNNLDLLISSDLEHYEIRRSILDTAAFPGARFAVWAPSAVEKDGKYYLIFAACDIHSEEEVGGLYLGVSDRPEGPFRNVKSDGSPFLNRIYGGAQPIDPHFFKEEDGTVWLYYGGWGHLMAGRMNDGMTGLLPRPGADFGGVFREITPPDYVEAPCVLKLSGTYHLMYSTGNWTDGTYRVIAAASSSPLGPFTPYDVILTASPLADGPGHNSAFFWKGRWYASYHRRTVGDLYPHNRRLCVDLLPVEDGKLRPVTMS